MQHKSVGLIDRFIACGSYLTLGTFGIIWFIVVAFAIRKPLSKFLMYNLFQSFIIAILSAIIGFAINIFFMPLFNLPVIGKFLTNIYILLFATPVFFTMSLVNALLLGLLCYLGIFSLLGLYPYLPFISKISRSLCR